MSDKKGVLKLNTKYHTGFGITSYVIGMVSLILAIIALIMSIIQKDTNTYVVGIMEIISTILCIIGVIFGIIGETTKETFKRYANLGLLLNGIALIYHIMVLIFGYTGY